MLSKRSLASISSQTRAPDFLLVVDDSPSEAQAANKQRVMSAALPHCQVTYLANQRTEGASGAWNTALYELAARVERPEEVFVAVLDDDDAWHPPYLERCVSEAVERGLDMVAADLRRFEDADEDPFVGDGPEQLRATDFLVGNPGVQGSNLFLRLSVLLAAGGFDEALRSSTDRDLCIRISDLGSVRYGRLPLALVDHFAEPDRDRLSTRGSEAKLAGLSAFWRKYVGRMSPDQQRAFAERAAFLFGWSPPPNTAEVTAELEASRQKKALVLALVADNRAPEELRRVVDVLTGFRDASLVGLDVILLEAGQGDGRTALLDMAAETLRDSGAGCFRLTLQRQAEDRALGLIPDESQEEGGRGLQRALSRFYGSCIAEGRTGSELWLAGRGDASPPSHARRSVDALLRWLHAEPITPAEQAWSDTESTGRLDRWILQERVSTAEHRVRRRFSLGPLRMLGHGSEAVVFTDGDTVYKCIDYWKTRMPRRQLDFLRSQVGRWQGVPGLYSLHEVAEDGPWAVLTYDYEASSPYEGGHEADLIRFLNGCAEAGVVCNNVYPKNLVVTASGVKLIDYGSDIRPWSSLGFEHMARRAFLACRHAAHPQLPDLMRRALRDPRLPEMRGYSCFRQQLDGDLGRAARVRAETTELLEAPPCAPFHLMVGVITSDPTMLRPLLRGLASLCVPGVRRISTLILDNGCVPADLASVITDARRRGLPVALADVDRQRQDASAGVFGSLFGARPAGQVGIAKARTMLQRYLGALATDEERAVAWVLDDDMRVDDRACSYLPWLAAFRDGGVDVLLGAYEGSSPNPPLNGLRVHLVDLLHNLHWLRGLPPAALLPDRSAENAALRTRFPDYYYDLSRKHTGHLEMPHWLEPVVEGETVAQAHARLLSGALGILSGAPLTRPIVATLPSHPLAEARDSVNRGGCTFVLNPSALTQTPNTITPVQGREARRSDMVWAIVNRYYRRLTVKAVSFPIHHVGRIHDGPSLNVEKVRGEIVGSTLYAGMTEFLRRHPSHDLGFSTEETAEIRRLADQHLERRWRALERSFRRIAGLSGSIQRIGEPRLADLCGYLDRWFTPEGFRRLHAGVGSHASRDVEAFLASLQVVADDFASARVDVGFIQEQLEVSR